jgi:serine/threonine protein kinase
MHIRHRETFTLVQGERLVNERHIGQYLATHGDEAAVVLVGAPFRIAARSVDQNATVLSGGEFEDIAFSFKVLRTATMHPIGEALDRMSIKPNGELLGEFNAEEIGNYTVVVTAVDGGGEQFQLKPFRLDVRQLDINVPNAGPNQKSCANNGVPVDESGDPFDGTFTSCDCSTIALYVGENCDEKCPDGHSKDSPTGTCAPDLAQATSEIATSTALAAVAGATVVLFLLAAVAARFRQYVLSMRPIDFDQLNRQMLANGTIPDGKVAMDRKPRELKRASVVLLERIGQGEFGTVWNALLDECSATSRPEYQVAAKTVLEVGSPSLVAAASEELLFEATVMAQLAGHKNLVALVGVVTSGTPLILVLAYCDHGSMLAHLTRCAADGEAVPAAFKTDFGTQTARGMEHLSERHFVHRDLAARNVLLASGQSVSNLVCKVADFGLSRAGVSTRGDKREGEGGEYYYKSQRGTFPVRWTAPEAMGQLKFTSASDVWSFGILLIEIIQDGTKPFPTFKSNPEVVEYTMRGGVHPKPLECDADASVTSASVIFEQLYSVACRCFAHLPAARPSFSELAESLEILTARALAGGSHAAGEESLRGLPTLSSLKMEGRGLIGPNCRNHANVAQLKPDQPAPSSCQATQLLIAQGERGAHAEAAQTVAATAQIGSNMLPFSSLQRPAAANGYGRRRVQSCEL